VAPTVPKCSNYIKFYQVLSPQRPNGSRNNPIGPVRLESSDGQTVADRVGTVAVTVSSIIWK
jgi:hypothetical protein